MTEQELLHLIRNADEKFYDEAEQEINRTNSPIIRRTVIRRVAAAASAVAVLAVSVSAGLYTSRNSGLTVGTSETGVNSIVEQVTNTLTDTTLPADTTNTEAVNANNTKVSIHGKLQKGVNGWFMRDDANWYFNDCGYTTPISDAESAPLSRFEGKLEENDDNLFEDMCGSGERYQYDPATRTVSLRSATAEPETLFTLEDLPEDSLLYDDSTVYVGSIAKLSNHLYLCTGFYSLKTAEQFYFRYMYDTEKQKASKFESRTDYFSPLTLENLRLDTPNYVFSDGDQGCYLNDTAGIIDFERKLWHITADDPEGSKNAQFDIRLYFDKWTIQNDALYTLYRSDPTNYDEPLGYARIDLKDGKITVLRKNLEWYDDYHDILFHDGMLYAAGPDSIQIMDLDMQNTRTIPLSIPKLPGTVSTAPQYINRIHIDLCGDTLCMEILYEANAREEAAYVLCNTETGKVQYAFSPEAADSDLLTKTTETVPEQTALTETTTQTEATTTQVGTTTQAPKQAIPDGMNYLGGHGTLTHLPQSDVMCDEDHWYENMVHGVPKSDAKYLPRETTAFGENDYSARLFFMDTFDNTIYHIHESEDFAYIAKINPDGTEAKAFPKLTAPFSQPGKNYKLFSADIANLGNGYYYITAYLDNINDESGEGDIPIWEIYDTSADTVYGQILSENMTPRNDDSAFGDSVKVCSDGANGVYVGKESWTAPSLTKIIRIEHRTADGRTETVLERDICHEAWFVSDDCIYYVSYDNQDYCKYDMKTKETTVLIKNTGWNLPDTGTCNLSLAEGTVYVVKNGGTLVYGDPDMTEKHEWKIEYPETMEVFKDYCFVTGVCDHTVFLVNQDAQFYKSKNDDDAVRMFARHEYSILYHTDTGKVQFIYDPEYYTPPTEN